MFRNESPNLPAHFWNELKKAFHNWQKSDPSAHLVFNDGKEKEFIRLFDEHYRRVKEHYMTDTTLNLDAHKQAAILLVSAIESCAITQTCDDKSALALGPYAIALDVALSFLADGISEKVKPFGVSIDKICMPIAFACRTNYFDVMRRLLYYENPGESHDKNLYDLKLNVLEWADRFFLLENITLLYSGIDPILLKDQVSEEVL